MEAFFSRYIAYFGVPNHIHTDVGTEFRNQLFEGLCTNLEISHSFAPVDQHSSNFCERVIRDLNKFFKILSDDEKATWSQFLPLFQIAQNSHVNDSIKTSPFQALTGRAISLAISLATPPPQNAINLPLQELFSRVLHETMLSKNKSIRIRS